MFTWHKAGHMNLELRRKLWVGDYQFRVLFKATGTREITKGESQRKKEKKTEDWGMGSSNI